MPTPPSGTKFYTYKANAQKAAKPGQIVEFTKGKGYWLYTPVTPPPPPPKKGVVAIYDNDWQTVDSAVDWPALSAIGMNTLICGADDTQALAELQKTGGKAWATVGHWNDDTGTFSVSDTAALQMAESAVKNYPGVIIGWYVADEPSKNPSVVAARSTLLTSVLNVETIIAMWDTSIFSAFKASASAFALDGYPNRDSWNMNDITVQAAAADKLGIRYYGVLGAFTDGGVYKLPTPAELQEMINTWNATKQVGIAVYEWGPAGGDSSTWLQNQPTLLAVLKAEYAS